MNRWSSKALHEELAFFYYQYKGITAPVNQFTESLWTKIEEVEREERASRTR
jgi:hypothetical protein